ncbi:NADH-quinone oxidoreductase subunit L [Permianibacter aggregans]|uniref:NADH dehydrogenase subunit L n=1 Tax=Permianibacter aggregans TaxID=1510150 RepID=A0A4R6UF76_9GAMM|nr:NADH-quinone oxidoreductase subunit L [Permianibacter aggregans]QGX40589.1 NADH-quinone oxidoreductase subunit L [Permianibacter aggregans]TDQ43849.1 NADH dehydrogenase subunit L [Permianibacter aggregans]
MENIYLAVVLAPLLGAIIAGLMGKQVGRAGAHWVTILGVAVSAVLSAYVFYQHGINGLPAYNASVYEWATIGGLRLEVGFLVDNLTAMMMVVVTFVSLMVHIYTIGYMEEDPGYQRFFSYISLFTFSMLMLVMANNFLQLFFGWEAVGLVSYLLIGFWFKKPTAIFANMKAFLVNRVGDFGFLIGIAAVLYFFGSMDYATVFAAAPEWATQNLTVQITDTTYWSGITVICIGLFIGAMGKSAQVPLHVWLPDSMEGPTPISALIHAATMVTAGVFMVARMSPLFELSETALSFVIVIGATTALFMGFIGVVQNDIKRVVAYSTLSQLGYMVTALGASAYAAGVFHLMTHAFFKALLFLAAGSVIIGMHHEQDIRKMGGLWKYMKITWIVSLVGSLALIGTPFFSGYYSKDAIIEAVHASQIAGSTYAYYCVLAGVFVTALYSFRMFFLVFHTKERFHDNHHDHHGHDDDHDDAHGHHGGTPHESPLVVTLPLIALAIPSLVVAWWWAEPMLFGSFFDGVIYVKPEHATLTELGSHWHGWVAFALHSVQTIPFWLAAAGVFTAWFVWVKKPSIADAFQNKLAFLHKLLDNKYYFDDFNQATFANGSVRLGNRLWKHGDAQLIDGVMVNGSANLVGRIAAQLRKMQSGYLYHYAFAMLIGLLVMISWLYFLI